MFWYITLGAIVGLAGTLTWQPVVNIPLPWWIRGLVFGGWLNFVLVLLIYDLLASVMISANFMGLMSPWWFVAEGAILGFVVDGMATRFAGEGRECVDMPDK